MKWHLLHKACWAGDREEAERLLDAGADPNQLAPTNWRQRPLGRTLEFRITHPKHDGHVAVVETLLKRGADPTVRSTYLDMTPYELACFCGLQAAADLLRPHQAAAPPHPKGMPALWLAASSRLREDAALNEVRSLITHEDINAFFHTSTPIMMATGHAGHYLVADALLEAGADPNLGTSILHADWHFQHLVPALRYFARNGWNVNGSDARGQTALHNAAFLGYAAMARTLLALGADPTVKNADGATPADVARRWRKAAVLKVLLRAA
jgi:ankyrin repeat protein